MVAVPLRTTGGHEEVYKKMKTCPMGVGRTTSWVMANVAVCRGGRLALESWDNATRRRLVDGAACGPLVDAAGYETPRRSGLTRTKAESSKKRTAYTRLSKCYLFPIK